MSLNVKWVEKQPGVFVVSPFGSLDTTSHAVLEQRMDYLIADNSATVITLDMAGVEYISSMGIRAILKAKKELDRRGGSLLMVNLQPQIKKVFEIINALPSMQIFSSIEELDNYLTEMQRRTLQDRP
jgi:anti-sigma B factor antagonist